MRGSRCQRRGAYVTAQGWRVIARLSTTDTRTVVSSIPLALMYAALVLGFGSGVLFLIAELSAARERPSGRARSASEGASARRALRPPASLFAP